MPKYKVEVGAQVANGQKVNIIEFECDEDELEGYLETEVDAHVSNSLDAWSKVLTVDGEPQ